MAKPNWSNRTIWTGDNLSIMRGMNSESVNLIYLDPPFNSNTDYAAPIGSEAAGAEFKDTWTLADVDIAWLDLIEAKHPKLSRVIHAALTNSDKSYLIYMAVRMLQIRRLLKKTGSIYPHCDPTMSHYLKLVMDAVFGRNLLRNEIVWHYRRWTGKSKRFQRLHDIILFYSKTDACIFNVQFDEYTEKSIKRKQNYHTRIKGDDVYVTHINENGVRAGDVWSVPVLNSQAKERVGYPTQKPLALLDRIIKASSNEGDIVLDPFCGCATTLVAADRLDRQWVGIDISPLAVQLVEKRIKDDQGLFQNIMSRNDVPQRTDLGELPKYNSINIKNALYGEQGGDCNGCGTHFEKQHLTVDHIIAQSKGGTDHIENLQLLCGNCNSVKGNRGMEYLLAKLAA